MILKVRKNIRAWGSECFQITKGVTEDYKFIMDYEAIPIGSETGLFKESLIVS